MKKEVEKVRCEACFREFIKTYMKQHIKTKQHIQNDAVRRTCEEWIQKRQHNIDLKK